MQKNKKLIKKEIYEFNSNIHKLNTNKLKSQKSFDKFAQKCRNKIKSRQNKSK